MLYKFDEKRNRYDPYGLTCELWAKSKMLKPDRHDELEINFVPSGSVTYLIYDKVVEIPENKLAVFWALTPHQIIHASGQAPYYVCTVPFNIFLNWNFPKEFIKHLLKGSVILDNSNLSLNHELLLFENWRKDIESKSDKLKDIALLELNARLQRLAYNDYHIVGKNLSLDIDLKNVGIVEKIAAYIASNYLQDIKTKDISDIVNLNPDYANRIFKDSFGLTIREYLLNQRISHAKRMLSTSNQKITIIALESGFNSISRFNASFLKICGISPNAYRKQHSHLSNPSFL
ncbi:MAG: transcriptional regulator [Thalassobius sp.]|nr:transcriptional regulator [Thalassovita sp.]